MQQNLVEQPVNPVVQQGTLVYADIGPSSVKKKAKQIISLRPDDRDDRVEYSVLNHNQLQKPVTTTTIAGETLSYMQLNIMLVYKHYNL